MKLRACAVLALASIVSFAAEPAGAQTAPSYKVDAYWPKGPAGNSGWWYMGLRWSRLDRNSSPPQ